jgi:hypothetical protein
MERAQQNILGFSPMKKMRLSKDSSKKPIVFCSDLSIRSLGEAILRRSEREFREMDNQKLLKDSAKNLVLNKIAVGLNRRTSRNKKTDYIISFRKK